MIEIKVPAKNLLPGDVIFYAGRLVVAQSLVYESCVWRLDIVGGASIFCATEDTLFTLVETGRTDQPLIQTLATRAIDALTGFPEDLQREILRLAAERASSNSPRRSDKVQYAWMENGSERAYGLFDSIEAAAADAAQHHESPGLEVLIGPVTWVAPESYIPDAGDLLETMAERASEDEMLSWLEDEIDFAATDAVAAAAELKTILEAWCKKHLDNPNIWYLDDGVDHYVLTEKSAVLRDEVDEADPGRPETDAATIGE